MKVKIFLVSLFCSLIFSCASSKKEAGKFYGIVVDENGNGLGGVEITADGQFFYETDYNGHYSFNDVDLKNGKLKFTASGYVSKEIPVKGKEKPVYVVLESEDKIIESIYEYVKNNYYLKALEFKDTCIDGFTEEGKKVFMYLMSIASYKEGLSETAHEYLDKLEKLKSVKDSEFVNKLKSLLPEKNND